MIKLLVIISFFTIIATADVMSYYKSTLKTLHYNHTYSLYKKANKIAKESVDYGRYANFSLDASYSTTKAKTLSTPFSTTEIAMYDNLDLFGRGSYKVEALALDLKRQKTLLDLQKEQLFISLVNMLALYHKTDAKLSLHKRLLHRQEIIYKKLKRLYTGGMITSIDLLRFKNRLTTLQTQIISEESQRNKMKKQLNIYAPNEEIPTLKSDELHYKKEDFLLYNPSQKINEIDAQSKLTEAKSSQYHYLPDVRSGISYQKLEDPTGYGDNYSFTIGVHMPLNGGAFKGAEALRANALMQKSRTIEYKIARENEYTKYYEDYTSAKKQLHVLNESLADYEKSEKTIQLAFLKQYVDFNTYLEVLSQTLHIKENIINMRYQERKQSTLLNAISSGKIYE